MVCILTQNNGTDIFEHIFEGTSVQAAFSLNSSGMPSLWNQRYVCYFFRDRSKYLV